MFYRQWLEYEKASACAFVTQSLQTISAEHWDAASYETRADPAYLATWYDGDRQNVFGQLSRLGAYRRKQDVRRPSCVIAGRDRRRFVVRGEVKMGRWISSTATRRSSST